MKQSYSIIISWTYVYIAKFSVKQKATGSFKFVIEIQQFNVPIFFSCFQSGNLPHGLFLLLLVMFSAADIAIVPHLQRTS